MSKAEHIMDKSILTKQAQQNLQDLADYLKAYAAKRSSEEVNEPTAAFGMGRFFNDELDKTAHQCGTSACAVGHYAIMREFECTEVSVIDKNLCELSWHKFSEEHIGVASHNEQAPIWDWLFSGRWQVYDDTPLGAAARIEYFLENGVPDEFTRQHAFDVDVIFAGGCYGRGIIAKYLPRRQALEAEYLTVA